MARQRTDYKFVVIMIALVAIGVGVFLVNQRMNEQAITTKTKAAEKNCGKQFCTSGNACYKNYFSTRKNKCVQDKVNMSKCTAVSAVACSDSSSGQINRKYCNDHGGRCYKGESCADISSEGTWVLEEDLGKTTTIDGATYPLSCLVYRDKLWVNDLCCKVYPQPINKTTCENANGECVVDNSTLAHDCKQSGRQIRGRCSVTESCCVTVRRYY